ncbi:MAG: Mur ligase family protein, partial [Bacteroidota bacterium]
MSYTIKQIAAITGAEMSAQSEVIIDHLLTDSRKIILPKSSLFFALKSARRNGQEFIEEVYERRVRCFVVEKGFDYTAFPDAVFLLVDDVLESLQELAAHHRSEFNYPVIGITGSNGKTIVKEWLNELLEEDYKIIRSPRSYNSQIGVPLSVWEMNQQHTLAIFEAGISTTNEMATLESVIRPSIGILTNIGSAHSEGFKDEQEKLSEKIKLFSEAEYVVAEYGIIPANTLHSKQFTWSFSNAAADIYIASVEKKSTKTGLTIVYQQHPFDITIPFSDDASISNAVTCISLMVLLSYDIKTIESKLQLLKSVEMRLQLKTGVNNCFLINDSYSNDLL